MTSPRRGSILRSSPWTRLATALVLVAVALAALIAVMADLAIARVAGGLGPRLAGDETVVVWSRGLESADAAAARASEVLAKVPGVAQSRWLDPAPGDGLAAAVVGAPGGADVRLISVTAPGHGPAMADRMVRVLAANGLPSRAVSHSGIAGLGPGASLLAAAALIPLAGLLIFAGVGWIEARREMARSRALVDLMRTSGAWDGYIAGEVRRRIGALALVAALWGAAAAMVAAALVERGGLGGMVGGLTRQDLVTPWPALILLLWLAGLAGADLSARARLKGMA